MPYIHKGLADGPWFKLTLIEQWANIGAEIGRALNWRTKGNEKLSWNALERGLELFDLTVSDPRWQYRLKEILRAREVVCDYFCGDNKYQSTSESLEKYFLQYALAARKDK